MLYRFISPCATSHIISQLLHSMVPADTLHSPLTTLCFSSCIIHQSTFTLLFEVCQLERFSETSGLGISLEARAGHHYLCSVLSEGPVGQSGKIFTGDQILEVTSRYRSSQPIVLLLIFSCLIKLDLCGIDYFATSVGCKCMINIV